jgi:hypothetical protein
MGFIMSRGPGTDEVLDLLGKAFGKYIKDTAAQHKPDFAAGKKLHAAAAAMRLWPTDPVQRKEWLRWLVWLSCFPNEHEVIRLFLYASLSGNTQPCVIIWDQDPQGSPKTPPKVTTGTMVVNGVLTGTLSVKTCLAANIPDPPC